MPIIEVHLLEGAHTAAQHQSLLTALTRRYSEVLDRPVGSVRAFLVLHRPEHWATGGAVGVPAPFFTALVLAGGSVEQRHRLLGGFTDVLVDVLGVDRALVRGRIVPVDPDDWAVGGVPASAARRSETAARSPG